jgi:uncharacterized protein (TIGR02145 family)
MAFTLSCSALDDIVGDSSSSSHKGSSSSRGNNGGGSSSSYRGSSSSGGSNGGGTASDAGETVKIGTQTWMKKNLDYNAPGSVCYENKSANCDKYGRLYDWATAMALPSTCNSNSCSSQISSPHRGICPSGWHIPSKADWEILVDFVGGKEIAGKKLKAKSGWSNNGNGTDDYGFSALPGGTGFSAFSASLGRRSVDNINSSDDALYMAGLNGYWWGATESGNDAAYGINIYYYYDAIPMGYGEKRPKYSKC